MVLLPSDTLPCLGGASGGHVPAVTGADTATGDSTATVVMLLPVPLFDVDGPSGC
jgi:hypothetical protein